MPNEMTEAHIVPGLAHALLISTRKFCGAECKVIFGQDEGREYFEISLMAYFTNKPNQLPYKTCQ